MTGEYSGRQLEIFAAGCIVSVLVTLVVYAPAPKMNFSLVDEYTYLHWAGTMPLPQYLVHAIDPRLQGVNYRPVRQILILVEYYLFHSETSYFHAFQALIHLINSVLVFGLVWHLSEKWRVGLLAALLFAGLPVISEAVLWISDEAPLATLFSLAAVWSWVGYLENKDKSSYLIAVVLMVLAFLTKESSAAVPIVFFVVDWIFFHAHRADFFELVRRYIPIAVISILYLSVEYVVQLNGLFFKEGGYSLGGQVISNYAAYFAMLLNPWGLPYPFAYLAFFVVGLTCLGMTISGRYAVLAFIMTVTVLAIGPVVLSPQGAYGRYLYLAVIPVAVLWAIFFEQVWVRSQKSRWLAGGLAAAFAGLIVLNGRGTADAAAIFSEIARQRRIPFADVMRQHPSFPNDTRLFFIEPPHDVPIPDVAGMFFLRYGTNVSVSGTYPDGRPYTGGRLKAEKANLRDYSTAYVYYFDETNRPIEIPVDKGVQVQSVPPLPVNFTAPIRLEGFEVTSSTFQKDKPLALILYWRATGRIDKDYTVFVHVVDSAGQMVAGRDSMPRSGKERTSQWRLDQFTADAHILTVPEEAVPGKGYEIQVGLYYLPTMQRLSILDNTDHVISNQITVAPFEVVE
jgi:hypothetical protein